MHKRQAIAEFVRDLLTGLYTTEYNVFLGRARPLPADHGPTLLIAIENERARVFSLKRPRTMLANATLAIEAKVKDNADPSEILAVIQAEVQTQMASEPKLGFHAMSCTYQGTKINLNKDGDKIVGSALIEYAIAYQFKEDAPSGA